MSKRTNPWDATSYRVNDEIEVFQRSKRWVHATVAKVGGWRMHVRYEGGSVEAIDSPKNVRMRKKAEPEKKAYDGRYSRPVKIF